MKSALFTLALGISLGGALVFGVMRDKAPTAVGEFTWDDRETLRMQYGGGNYVTPSLYVRCESGQQTLYYPDGARLTRSRACWK